MTQVRLSTRLSAMVGTRFPAVTESICPHLREPESDECIGKAQFLVPRRLNRLSSLRATSRFLSHTHKQLGAEILLVFGSGQYFIDLDHVIPALPV